VGDRQAGRVVGVARAVTVVTGSARLDAAVDTAATAKVGAKGVAHWEMLEDGGEFVQPAQMWPAPSRRMAIPKKRRR
jgi:hypothetical protein